MFLHQSTHQHKICENEYNILCKVAASSSYMSAVTSRSRKQYKHNC